MIRFILALVISAILAMGLILLASKHGFTAECLTVNTLKSQVVSRLPEAIIIEMGGTETKGSIHPAVGVFVILRTGDGWALA